MSSENKKPRIPLGGKSIDKGDSEKPTITGGTNDSFGSEGGTENSSGPLVINDPFGGEDHNEKSRIEEERRRKEELERLRLEKERRRKEELANEEKKEVILEIDPNTTYFFVFGTAAAGKSTMVSSLAYYLKAFASGQVVSISSADKQNHQKGNFILKEMIKDVKKGKFVLRTRNLTDEVLSSEINLLFKPDNFKKAAFPFCILEMAGEDLEAIELRDFGRSGGILDERINAYLEHPDCSMIFICVVDTEDPSESEDYIDKFLDYARKLGHAQNPVLVTINKWDKVADKYTDGEHYLKENAPIIYRKLQDPDRSFSYMPFSIGKKGVDKDYIYNPSDAQKLFEWMYEESIGESLYDLSLPSMLDKMFASLKSIFKK